MSLLKVVLFFLGNSSLSTGIATFVVVSAILYFINPIYILWPGFLESLIGSFAGVYVIANRGEPKNVGKLVAFLGGLATGFVETLIDNFFYGFTTAGFIIVGMINTIYAVIGALIGGVISYHMFFNEAKVDYKSKIHVSEAKKRFIPHTPQANAWNNKGIAELKNGNFQEALASFDKGIMIEPTSAMLWTNKGIALKNLGKYQAALEVYNYAIQLNPSYPQVWYNRGNVLSLLGNYTEALKSHQQALILDPNYSLARKAYNDLSKRI